jgi:hypothetical protein
VPTGPRKGFEQNNMRGLERWQRRHGPPANEEVAVAKQSIARTEIIGRMAVGCVFKRYTTLFLTIVNNFSKVDGAGA